MQASRPPIPGQKLPAKKLLIEGNIAACVELDCHGGACAMNSVIYFIGLVVVVLAVLSFLGFH
ncbi:hypothetical protein EJ074_10230 [Mesorhizobium sp. M3A.F.Ca.ET.080.04.2.1]|nr:hypothetical protein EJ074_10230 [Mesorhizobium sp. M3A.F.Ca.ET.080.04.2.1]